MDLDRVVSRVKEELQRNPARLQDEKAVIQKFGQLFRYENIDNITAEQFQSFLDFKENRHWTIHRQKTTLTADMPKLKQALKILLNESVPLEERLKRLKDHESSDYMGYLGRAVFSAILLVTNPTKYPVYNETVEKALEKIGMPIDNNVGPIWKEYPEIQQKIVGLAAKYGLTLWQIDFMWWLVLGELSFDDLVKYVREMIMQENYQPVVIKTLIGNNGRATREVIEQELRKFNPRSSSKSMVNTVLSVLNKNKILRQQYEDEYILNVPELLSQAQAAQLTELCDQRLREFESDTVVTRHWKIAPGEQAKMWNEQRTKGIIGIEWNELEDLSDKEASEIEAKIRELWPESQHVIQPQIRDFLSIRIGDIVIANKGISKVVGIGRVTSNYEYRPDLPTFHTYHVDWFDTVEKSIPRQEGVWAKTVSPINEELYKIITAGFTTRAYLLLRHTPDFKRTKSDREYWDDILGKDYEFGKIATYTKVLPGTRAIWFYTDKDDIYFWGFNEVRVVEPREDKLVAKFDSFTKFSTSEYGVKANPVVQNKVKNLDAWNKSNSIMEIGEGVFDDILRTELMRSTYLTENQVDEIAGLLDDKKQIIFYGPPGTGKTYVSRKFASYFTRSESNVVAIQFHPSYSYEDFVEGLKPGSNGSGYSVQSGLFRRIVDRCIAQPNERFLLIIDEINRGNISRIFGELIYLLEYRNEKVQLLYSPDKEFFIPDNLYIIGTMNSADRSIAFIDYALRRRFYFKNLYPNVDILRAWLAEPENKARVDANVVANSLDELNKKLVDRIGKEYEIGHSFFMVRDLDGEKLRRLNEHAIIPLMEQYFFGNKDRIREFTITCNRLFAGEAEKAGV